MGISRDHWHKRRATGGKRKPIRKKRKYELGRPAAMTKLAPRRVHVVRVRGGNKKFRALRLDHGNFAWPSEHCTRKTRIIDVVYNSSNNELVRTKTLVKNCIVLIDAAPFRTWYEQRYNLPIGKKRTKGPGEKSESASHATDATGHPEEFLKTYSKQTMAKYRKRAKVAKIEPALEDQIAAGRLLACISSRPGQVGRADGYVLEGKELEFYLKKIKSKKGKQ